MMVIQYSFICCVWNEINRAPDELDKLIHTMSDNNLLDIAEILLIDNDSSDGTREWIKSLDYPGVNLKKILNSTNIGKGGSIRTGIINSSGSIAAIYDLDGEYVSTDALIGFDEMRKTSSVMSLASRTLDGRSDYVYFKNFIGVRFLSEYINILYNERLTDTATGLKILNTSFFKENLPRFNGFNVDFELICITLNNRQNVSEYNGQYYPRSLSEGKKIRAFRDGFASLIAITLSALNGVGLAKITSNTYRYVIGRSAFRYFVVGFVSALIDICSFWIFTSWHGLTIIFSNRFAFVLAITSNYFLGITIVFAKNVRFNSYIEFTLVTLTSFVSLVFNTLLIYLLVHFGVLSLFAKCLAVIPSFFLNYLFRRLYIYRKISSAG